MGERRRMSDPTADNRRVHFLGIPCGQAKGGPHDGYRWSYARERVTCGGCRNTTAFRTSDAPARPTILTFHGETGEDGCGPGFEGHAFGGEPPEIWPIRNFGHCPAPTPEAP